MDPTSATIVTKALDALSLRMSAVAANIANASSPNYRPQRVRFEDSLRVAAAHGLDALRAIQPKLESDAPGTLGGEQRMDLELASATDTAMRYNALVNLLGREMEIARIGLGGGQ